MVTVTILRSLMTSLELTSESKETGYITVWDNRQGDIGRPTEEFFIQNTGIGNDLIVNDNIVLSEANFESETGFNADTTKPTESIVITNT